MSYAQITDCRLHYTESGVADAPETIIFLHGFTLDRRQWAEQVRFFSDPKNTNNRPYRVLALDSRAHGLSDAPESGYSRAHRVKDLLEFADILEIERFHLVGLSMGGTTGIGFALEHPKRLKSLTLVSSAAAGYSIGKKISSLDKTAREKGVEAAKKRWMRMTLSYYNEDQADIAELMTQMVNDHTGAIWLDPMRGNYPREDDLSRVSQIDMPVLLMCGQADKVFHEVGELLHERIKGSQFISYPNVGHMVNLEIPTQFSGDLKVFLEGLQGQVGIK